MDNAPDWLIAADSLFGMPFHFWTLQFFLVGAMVGSFLNVCIHRMPRDESVFNPPSHCPHCGYRIPWGLNIPIITWFWLRGRCRSCQTPISPRYVLIEILTAGAFVASWLVYGREQPGVAFAAAALLAIFIGSTVIDFEHIIIPDQFTLGGTVMGFLFSAFVPSLHGELTAALSLKKSGLGIAVGAGVVYLVLRGGKLLFGRQKIRLAPGSRIVFTETVLALPNGEQLPYEELFYRQADTVEFQAQRMELPDRGYANQRVRIALRREPPLIEIGDEKLDASEVVHLEAITDEIICPREAMGLGDVKFMACIGAFLGWQATLFSFALSSMLGAVVGVTLIALGKKEWSGRLPFGPYIAVAATVWLFGGNQWAERWFGR